MGVSIKTAAEFDSMFASLLGVSGNAANLIDPATKYLFGIGIGLPAIMMNAILAPALQLDKQNCF